MSGPPFALSASSTTPGPATSLETSIVAHADRLSGPDAPATWPTAGARRQVTERSLQGPVRAGVTRLATIGEVDLRRE
ncbi:MAG: hypothetical protein M3P50_06790 [Actinomycetota bacterium]|nr:hypothetical protein [Actinomycetota bacterium]